MPDIIETKRVAVNAQLKRMVDARKEKGPSQDPDELRYAVLFYPYLQSMVEDLFNNPEKYVGLLSVAEVKELGATGLALAEKYLLVQDRFHEAHAQVNRRGRSYQLYGPVPKERAEEGAAVLSRLRAAAADAMDANDPKGAAIREGCGVGGLIRYESPVDVQRALRLARVVLQDPEYAEAFADACLPLAAFQRMVQQALTALETALLAGPGDAALQARTNRTQVQLELECTAAMAMSVVATALGREKRDELRAFWPSTTRKPSHAAANNAQEVDGTANTVDGSLVPTGTGTTTPLSWEPGKASPVPALQPLFGTSVPKSMLAGAAGSGGSSSGGNGTPMALIAGSVSNGVNGTANGTSHP